MPVAHCADCAGVQVAVDLGPSCSKCMGPLVADSDVLDARFVGALWPLVASGWPADAEGPSERAPFTSLVVDGPVHIESERRVRAAEKSAPI